ncbi:MAG: site-specific integrase [Chloroflexaceae bacterium]|nr:site-specific integrase [Chloroflexaceae bacterium]
MSPHARALPRRRLGLREALPPDPAQWAALLAACDRRAPRSAVGLWVRFLAYTGLRLAEARALTWAEVRADRLLVPARVAKGGRPRAVPVHPALADTLAALRRLTRDAVDGAWRAAPVLPRPVPRRALRAAAREAGLRWVTFHTLRHWYATRAIEAGVDLPTVARWLGHADGGALLARTYFHLAPGHDRAAAQRLGAAWGG